MDPVTNSFFFVVLKVDICGGVFMCFAAEKVTSLGKDWHRPCLRCEKCKKVLSSGSHAEVRRPYDVWIGKIKSREIDKKLH